MFKNLLLNFYSVSLFLVGAACLAMPSGYSLGFYLITLISFCLWIKDRDNLLPTEARFFLWPIVIYGVGSCLLALYEKVASREFDTHLPFLLFLFGFWGLRKFKPNAKVFWLGLATGAILSAFISGYQSIGLGIRAEGFGVHPIQFGNIALLLGVLCMVRAIASSQWSRLNFVLWIGFVAGLASSMWSQTRGGWLAVALIIGWILINATKSWPSAKRVTAAFFVSILLALPALQPNGLVQLRVTHAVKEFNGYFENAQQDTSVGSRLAMWRLAIGAIMEKPSLLGNGNQGWIELRDAAVADGRLSPFSSGFTHLHNEYLNIVFKRGFLGLIFLLAMYLVPMLTFFRPYLYDDRPDVRALAMSGMVIPMMFMDFGLTQAFLSHNSGRVVLCSLWMCTAALLLNTIDRKVGNHA